jgi:hypothetical protein
MHVRPVRGCVCGVVGPVVQGLTTLGMRVVVSGTRWEAWPEWVRVPYAKTAVACLDGVPE